MRILFTFIGCTGHLLPLIPFARAAEQAGHTVAFAGPGGQCDRIREAGFHAFQTSEKRSKPSGVTAQDRIEPVDLAAEESTMAKGFAGTGARRHVAVIRDFALEWKPDVIVRDEVDFGAGIAAETLGIPCAPVIVLAAGGLARQEVVGDLLDELRIEHGLAADADFTAVNGQLVIAPEAPSMRDPRYALPAETLWCRSGPAAPSRSLDTGGGQPLVYFTLGTYDTYQEVFERVLAGLRDLPVRVVTTVGPRIDPASFGPQPERFRVEHFVPQDELFPQCDLVIAHGGSGTLIGSLAHGIPSVLLPMGADQPWNARRCVELGTALELA